MSYSTGEIADLCGVTVRTVQYYDREGLLKPDGYSEGGRRLYGDESLKRLQIICMYRELGFSISEIRGVLSEEDGRKLLSAVLEQKEKLLDEEIRVNLVRRDSIRQIKKYLAEGKTMTPNTFFDVQTVIKGRRKMKNLLTALLIGGLLIDAAEIAFIVLWVVQGVWLPFAAGMPLVAVVTGLLVAVYYKNTQYVCAECGQKFKPKVCGWLLAFHTSTTRKLTCPHCGKRTYHIEIYSDQACSDLPRSMKK